MNKSKQIIALVILFAVMSLALVGCENQTANESSRPAESESEVTEEMNEYAFYATVAETESVFGGILVKPEGEALPPELVVHSGNMPAVSVGDRVKVLHSGQITMSYPGQIFGATVTVAE